MIHKLARALTRKPRLIAFLAVLLLIPSAIGMAATKINYDPLTYLPEEMDSSQGMELLEEPFHMAATSMLIVEDMPADYTNRLLRDIQNVPGVSSAIWLSSLVGIQIPTDMIPANFRDMFFAGDATMMIIQYSHPGASDETMEAIEQVRRACNEKCFLAGFSVVIKDTRDLMDSELPIFVGLAVLLSAEVETVTGRGGGVTDESFMRKKAVIHRAIELNRPDRDDPVDVLAKVGGFDLAAMCGAFLGAAATRRPVVIDGFISAVAALCAVRLCPRVRDYLVPSHASFEIGYRLAMEAMSLEPLFLLGMRLGEGSGCPLAFQVLSAACAVMNDMATFDQAGIDDGYLDEIRQGDQFTVEGKS